MFACYRRGDANDPDGYVAAVAAVLARYEPSVIEYVTDPYTGIPGAKRNGYGGLPDVADVKCACESEATRRARLADLGSVQLRNLPRIPKPKTKGMRANVLVRTEAPQYTAMVELTKGADDLDWCWDADGRGIWVALPWLDKVPRRFAGRIPASEAAE